MSENIPKPESFDTQVSRLADSVEKTLSAEKNSSVDKAMGLVMVTELRKKDKGKADEHAVIELYRAVEHEVKRRQNAKKLELADDLLPKNQNQEGQEELPLE